MTLPSPGGVAVCFVTLVATTMVLSKFSLFLFAGLIEGGDENVLMTSVGPLSYALGVLVAVTVLGVWVCSRVAGSASLVDATRIIVLYAAFSYWLSQTPSGLEYPYTRWFEIAS